MKLVFDLAITLLVIGVFWFWANRIVDAVFCDYKLGWKFYAPSIIVVFVSAFMLVVLGLIALWR